MSRAHESPRSSPFGRDERPAIVDALVGDPAIRAAVAEERQATGRTSGTVDARVRAYAEEIVPDYRAHLHHRIAYRLARRLATTLFRVRVGYVDQATLTAIPATASVVFVINHRSNMDYVLLAFLAAERVALSFAVGEWARVWPLDSLVRALGAFFVRRDSRDALYRKVLEVYVRTAIERGVPQAVFIEGGLSRDGRLRPPKLGLLAYATRHFSRSGPRDLVFVPVAINYDRVLEDRTLVRDLDPTLPRWSKTQTTATALGWFARNAAMYARGRFFRFGYACVNFGPPLSLRDHLVERGGEDWPALSEEARAVEIDRLGARLIAQIGDVVPVTPVSLVASALLSFDDGVATRVAVADRVGALMEELASAGARVYLPRNDRAYLLDVGLRMLVLRHLVDLVGGVYRVVPAERTVVAFYANSIAHFWGRGGADGSAADRSPGAAPPARAGARSARAVVLVHGLARTARSMARLARALETAGYAVYNWDYPSRRYGLAALVDALDVFVGAVAPSTERLDFVTHSMGGLLVRGVLARRPIVNLGRVVMLAPPNQGAELASRVKDRAWARNFFGQALDDLTGASGTPLAGLGSPPCPFGIVAGTRSFHPLQPTSYYSSLVREPRSHDGTVKVAETRLAGMADFTTVNANHAFIMDHEVAIRQTIAFLERGRFDRHRETTAEAGAVSGV